MPPNSNWHFEEDLFILCEGKQDKHFLMSLISERRLPPFQVRHAAECNDDGTSGGRDGFGPAIQGFEVNETFGRLRGIAIITDNDNSETLSNTMRALVQYGFVPTGATSGTLAGKPVRIILIPDNNTIGSMENLCLPVFYDTWNDSRECVEEYLKCTGANNWTRQSRLSKATIGSIIAGNYEQAPNTPIGYLFSRGVLSTSHECFNNLAETLRQFADTV